MIITILAASIAVGSGAFMKPYDGDTLRLKLRLADIDTPEIKGDCDNEIQLARTARDFSNRFINGSDERIIISFVGVGFFGRPLVRVCNPELCLSQALQAEVLAVPYVKGRKDNPWCK